MLAMVDSFTLWGLEGRPVRVEVDISNGLPAFDVVGLPDESVREARERVRAAIRNSGLKFPNQRITVNLAPADLRKAGPSLDLPIAVGLLAASEQVPLDRLEDLILLGELALNGEVRPLPGVLPIALAIGHQRPDARLVVPAINAREAALARNGQVLPVLTLSQLVEFLQGEADIAPAHVDPGQFLQQDGPIEGNLAEVKGQLAVKRALEIAAAGGHNLLLIGPPGSGKTMLARRLSGLLPELELDEALEVTQIYSVAGLLPVDRPLLTTRPFRAPHHNASTASLVGGGRIPKPGEVSLATHGVLFLDELPEYSRDVLEALRQPLEDRVVTISRIAAALTYPARFMLIAAMNPCPCGYWGDLSRECSCTPYQVWRYRHRISGPLLDRIDLQVEVPRLPYQELQEGNNSESSEQVRLRVKAARADQLRRQGHTNAELRAREMRRVCQITRQAEDLLRQAYERLALSARAHDRLLKVARTIADLAGLEQVGANQMAEALQYRCLDRPVV